MIPRYVPPQRVRDSHSVLRVQCCYECSYAAIVLNHLAPADRWNYDILEADGIARMRQVAQDVRAMCEALG